MPRLEGITTHQHRKLNNTLRYDCRNAPIRGDYDLAQQHVVDKAVNRIAEMPRLEGITTLRAFCFLHVLAAIAEMPRLEGITTFLLLLLQCRRKRIAEMPRLEGITTVPLQKSENAWEAIAEMPRLEGITTDWSG